MDEIQQIQYQVGEAWKGEYKDDVLYSCANVVQDPTGFSIYRSLKSGNIGHPLTDTVWWFKIIDLSSIKDESDRIAALNEAIAADEAARARAERAREQQSASDHQQAGSDHTQAQTDHGVASGDHTTAAADHQTAQADHQTAAADHTQAQTDQGKEVEREQAEALRVQAESARVIAENDRAAAEAARHQQYAADHTQAGTDHTASTEATAKANNVNATISGTTVTITDKNGVSTSVDIGFDIYKTYASVSAMNADAANVAEGKFVMIATTDTTSAENARLYVRNENAASSETPFNFLCDLDQAASSAWADWFNNYKPTIESDHTRAEGDHTQASTDHGTAAADHTLAGNDHSTAAGDHTQAGTDHQTASADHTQAGNDHTLAGTDHNTAASDHTTAGNDHTTAGTDHTTAGNDHTRAESDHTRAESDHAGIADKVSQSDLEDGTVVPLMSQTLEAWADQKGLAKEDVNTDRVRTSGGNVPLETSEGSKPVSIKPTSDWTAKFFFNGSYNMLKAAKWGNTNSQSLVGGNLTGGCYFLVPKLTLGEFGTAAENNGLLFTLEDGTNINPTVYFKALGNTAPTSLTDGVAITPTAVSFNGKTYHSYECSGPGWFILTYPSGKTMDDICAHIAWEDWYNKYVGLDEEDDPTAPDYNPEAAIGVLMLESFLATGHADKKLYYISDEVRDWVEFLDTEAKLHNIVDIKASLATDWTNEEVEEGSYLHTASVDSAMKPGGEAILADGTELDVEGTSVSFRDTNATVSGDKLNIKYECATDNVITKAYTNSVFNGSNISTTNGKLNINDCSIEAQVGVSGTAEVTVKYAINTVDKLAMIAQLDFQEVVDTVGVQEQEIEELTRALYDEQAKDADTKYGQPRILWGNGTPAESTVPTNWKQFLDGGYNWIGKPAFVGQVYINTAVTTGGYYCGYLNASSELAWRTIVA